MVKHLILNVSRKTQSNQRFFDSENVKKTGRVGG
jgi:hypothetical protein